MIQPVINKGIGALTPDTWRRLMAMLRNYELESSKPNPSKSSDEVSRFVLARITQATTMEVGRWRYGWERVSMLGGLASIVTVSSSSTYHTPMSVNTDIIGSQTNAVTWAINVGELGNTTTKQNGYTINAGNNKIVNSDNTVSEFVVGSVPVNTIVKMDFMRHAGTLNRLQPIFSYCNPVNGACATQGFNGIVNIGIG